MPSRSSTAGKEKSMPGFIGTQNRLPLLWGTVQLVTWSWSQYPFTILKMLEPLRIILNLLCLCFINGTMKPGWQYICLHSVTTCFKHTIETYHSEKKMPLKILCVCVCTESCLTNCDPVDCSPAGSSANGIFQARLLEWVAISYSRGSNLCLLRLLHLQADCY